MQAETPTHPGNQIIVAGPVVVIGGEAVRITPTLEAALRRDFERGHERQAAYYAANPQAPRWPGRYDTWPGYIQAALSDWLYGSTPAEPRGPKP